MPCKGRGTGASNSFTAGLLGERTTADSRAASTRRADDTIGAVRAAAQQADLGGNPAAIPLQAGRWLCDPGFRAGVPFLTVESYIPLQGLSKPLHASGGALRYTRSGGHRRASPKTTTMKVLTPGRSRLARTKADPRGTSMPKCLVEAGPERHQATAPARPLHSARTTLDDFIARLLELRARGAGCLPVVIETRSRAGELIYGEANARKDRLVWNGQGFRSGISVPGELQEVVRVG